jgi:SAM-dependent methyltransferase
VSFGDLRRLTPVARAFGFARGLPVDRVYIESFLEFNALAIRGRVLEVGDNAYTRRFGKDRVTKSDILHVKPGHPDATVVADLAAADHVPANTFDCIICTQTLQLVFDLPAAAATLHRILKPGGVLLLTVPGISHLDDPEWTPTWYWSFTPVAARALFGTLFGAGTIEVESYGNVLTSIAFLHGLAAEDLAAAEVAHRDPVYPLLVTLKAVKPVSREELASGASPDPASVSIIICSYNQAHFLGQAIESALAQTHTSVEIVVVDDGSSDNAQEVVSRYPGVSYQRQSNAGLSAARNAGLRHTHGEYVIFLDADDRLRPDAAATGLNALAARPDCACATGHHHLIGVDGAIIQQWVRPPVESDRYALLLKGNYVSMCAAVLFRRAALAAVGEFDPTLPAAEDYDLYLRIARRFPICDHDVVVAEYRRHGAGLRDDTLLIVRSALRVLKAQKPFTAGNAVYLEAWRAGLRHWQDCYCRETGKRQARQLEEGAAVRRVLPRALALARLAPAGLRLAWRSLMPLDR